MSNIPSTLFIFNKERRREIIHTSANLKRNETIENWDGVEQVFCRLQVLLYDVLIYK